MNFFLFLLFYIICTVILGVVLVVLYRLYMKRKVKAISKENEKILENVFNNEETLEKFFDKM